jgi:hypothetical protein
MDGVRAGGIYLATFIGGVTATGSMVQMRTNDVSFTSPFNSM